MKKYKYVVGVGCSFTVDPPHDKFEKDGKSYARLISEHFGAKYYDLADCGFSMQGMNRRTLKWCSKNKDKFKDTLIILGMTVIHRSEIWSNKLVDTGIAQEGWTSHVRAYPDEPTHASELKVNWSDEERRNYFINFVDQRANFLMYTNTIIGLQSFLELNDIDHIHCNTLFAVSNYYKLEYKLLFDSLVSYENWYIHPEYETLDGLTSDNPEMRVTETDIHPNKRAHKYWAECLLEYINERT